MRFLQLTITRRVFALSIVALAGLPAAGEAALLRYTFSGIVTSQSSEGSIPFDPPAFLGDQLGQTVQITALLDPDRLAGRLLYWRPTVSTEVPQLGGGTASVANGYIYSRNNQMSTNRYGFMALIARFADGQEFDPARGDRAPAYRDRYETLAVYNDIHAPGVAEPSDALYISATNTPYFDFGADLISITGTFSSSALSRSAFGEIPNLAPGDVVTAVLSTSGNLGGNRDNRFNYSSTYEIDVFAINARPAVPEPEGYMFVAAGLLGTATVLRRRVRNRI